MGFKGNDNPCLYVKKSAKGVVYVALYVDDSLMVGNIEAKDRENGLVLEIMERLQDYLSYEIKFSTDKKRAWLGQPHLMKNQC